MVDGVSDHAPERHRAAGRQKDDACGPLIDGAVTAASAVKMAYGAWTKGTAALILAIREFAKDQRVEEALLAEWALSQPKLEQRSQGSARARRTSTTCARASPRISS